LERTNRTTNLHWRRLPVGIFANRWSKRLDI
jgi:hypothetical protein